MIRLANFFFSFSHKFSIETHDFGVTGAVTLSEIRNTISA